MELTKILKTVILIFTIFIFVINDVFAQKMHVERTYETSDLEHEFLHPESVKRLSLCFSDIEKMISFDKFSKFKNLENFSILIEKKSDLIKIDSLLKIISLLSKVKSLRIITEKKLPKGILLFNNITFLELEFKKSFDCSTLRELAIKLKSLQELDIFCNNISEIPECIFNFSSVREIGLSGYSIRKITDGISKLKNLEFLRLNTFGNIKQLPNDIGELKNLKILWVQGGIKDIPSSMFQIDSLRTIDFRTINPNEFLTKKIIGIKSLLYLEISNDDLIKVLKENPYVKESNIDELFVYNTIDSIFPQEVFDMPNLTKLNLELKYSLYFKGIENSRIKHFKFEKIMDSNVNWATILNDLSHSKSIETLWINFLDLNKIHDTLILKLQNTPLKELHVMVDSSIYENLVFPNNENEYYYEKYFDGNLNTILGDGTKYFGKRWTERTQKLLRLKSDEYNKQIIERYYLLLPKVKIVLNPQPRAIFRR